MEKEILVKTHPRNSFDEPREPFNVKNFRDIIANSSDISLLIDKTGKIYEIFLNKNIRLADPLEHWVDRNINDFLTLESQTKIERILKLTENASDELNRPLELNHLGKGEKQIPVSYTVHVLEKNEKILLTGRDLRPIEEIQQQLINAQILLEREYEKYRGFDTRFRVILENATEGLVLIETETGRITDINSTAAHLLSSEVIKIVNSNLHQVFKNQSKEVFLESLKTQAAKKKPESLKFTLQKRNVEVNILPLMFRANGEILILCRIEPAQSLNAISEDIIEALMSLYKDCPDGIIFSDDNGFINFANNSFLNLCNITKLENLRGKFLADFLARGVVDQRILMENASENGSIQMYSSNLKTNFGMEIPIKISATHLRNQKFARFGYIVRDDSGNQTQNQGNDTVSEKALQNVMKLVGSAPLKELVADTSDVVERLCIETALELTRNNRVAASEMLGVSRQSLYVKLRKYDLMAKDGEQFSGL